MHLTSSIAHGRHKTESPLRDDDSWREYLPAEWRAMVVEPLSFVSHREYEIPASRTLGYAPDNEVCYYRHCYLLAESRSDNDEEFYPVVTRGESLRAWRLRDDRWLTYRIALAPEEATYGRGFYAFSASCPR